jgi:hypothetical protein
LDTLQRAWQRDGQLAHWLRRSTKWHMEVRWLIDHLLFLDAMTFFWTVKMEVIFYVLLRVIGISWRRPGGATAARAPLVGLLARCWQRLSNGIDHFAFRDNGVYGGLFLGAFSAFC